MEQVCKELGLEKEVCMIERGALKVWPGAGSDDKVRASREAVQLLQGEAQAGLYGIQSTRMRVQRMRAPH
jgi:hypothetical protein